MGFNSAFKGLILCVLTCDVCFRWW